jgi:hypothetical protein
MHRHWPDSLRSEEWEIVRRQAIDDLIEATFGRPWSMGQNDSFHNDSVTWFEVGPDPEATAKVQEWLASQPSSIPGRLNQPGNSYRTGMSIAETVEIYTDTLLSELCNKGILPEGDMQVYVSW